MLLIYMLNNTYTFQHQNMHILLTITSGSTKACKGFQGGYRMCGTAQLGH